MIDFIEKTIWGLSLLVLATVIGWFAYLGGPSTVPFILAESESVDRKVVMDRLTPEAKVALEKALNPERPSEKATKDKDGKPGKTNKKPRKGRSTQEYMLVNRATFERVATKNEALKEADKAKSEVVQNKDGSNSLRVYDFSETSILSQVGVEENDVVDLVDGKKIDFTSPLEANQLYDECKAKFDSGVPIVVEVTRRGRPVQIVVSPNF